MRLQQNSAVLGAKESKSSTASYAPTCYSAAKNWDMVVTVRDKREILAPGIVVKYKRGLFPQES